LTKLFYPSYKGVILGLSVHRIFVSIAHFVSAPSRCMNSALVPALDSFINSIFVSAPNSFIYSTYWSSWNSHISSTFFTY